MIGKGFLLVVVSAVYGYLLWIVYLMVARPVRFVDWFFRRPNRFWGLSVTIDDEKKLRRRSRFWGWLLLAFGLLHASLVFWAILKG